MVSNSLLSPARTIKNGEKEMAGKKLILIEQNCVPVNIVGSAHAPWLNFHSDFLRVVLFYYLYFTHGKNPRPRET